MPAADRPFPARALCLPFSLRGGERAELYLRVDHHSGSIYLPTDVTTTEDFLAWEMTYPTEQHWVWLLGFYLSSALFNLVLFAFLRDRIHVWYVLYVACLMLFLLMEDGLDALVLPAGAYHAVWAMGQYTWLLLGAACGLRIMQLFVRARLGWHLAGRGCGRVRAGLHGAVSGGGAGRPARGPGHAQRGPGSATASRAGLLLGGPGLCPGWATAPAGRLLLPHLRLLFQRLYLVLA